MKRDTNSSIVYTTGIGERCRNCQRPVAECVCKRGTPGKTSSDGTVRVVNRCVREDGNFDEAVGTARVVPVAGQPGAGRLEVRFAPAWLSWLPMVWGDYWILKLDRDYQVSLVGTPDREYLWVLSRAPRLDDAVLQAELDYARSLGFDTGKVTLTGR